MVEVVRVLQASSTGTEVRVATGPRFTVVVPGGTHPGPFGPVTVSDTVLGEVDASALSDPRVSPALLRACIREAARPRSRQTGPPARRVLRAEKRRRALARVRPC